MAKFLELYESIMESVSLDTIRPQSVVVIDASALKNKTIAEDIVQRKGISYLAQLQQIAKDQQKLYVSALKTVRPVNNVHASLGTSNDFQEADVVNYVPGLLGAWSAPMTLPISILKTVVASGDMMQQHIPGKETKQGREVGDNSYNNGEQHPNVVGQKEKRNKK